MAGGGQTALVCRCGPLPAGTGPVREQTGSGPGSSQPQTGTTQYQMDPSARQSVFSHCGNSQKRKNLEIAIFIIITETLGRCPLQL